MQLRRLCMDVGVEYASTLSAVAEYYGTCAEKVEAGSSPSPKERGTGSGVGAPAGPSRTAAPSKQVADAKPESSVDVSCAVVMTNAGGSPHNPRVSACPTSQVTVAADSLRAKVSAQAEVFMHISTGTAVATMEDSAGARGAV